ncbi:MAG: HAD-IIB family hydrolase [Actinomycetota bacterium]
MTSAPSVVLFDLDDTLAPSKTALSPAMADLLVELVRRTEVCVISGGRFEQFEAQLLTPLAAATPDTSFFTRLHLMPTCGTRYYTWESSWILQYAQDLTTDEKQRAIAALNDGADALDLRATHTWGPMIEDRGSQITFSALGQAAPVDAKHAWDPRGERKEALRAYVAARVPDLEVRSGGSTSVDVTSKGIDKAYGVRRLCETLQVSLDELLFIGDRLDIGGNDYPVKVLGVECISVTGPADTEHVISELLATGFLLPQ